MSAEEKARELVDKYMVLGAAVFVANQCALICVDEILLNNFWESEPSKSNHFIYWQQVKQAIEKP